MIKNHLASECELTKLSEYNFELNAEISEDEALKLLCPVKLKKACPSDLLFNEFLKVSKTEM